MIIFSNFRDIVVYIAQSRKVTQIEVEEGKMTKFDKYRRPYMYYVIHYLSQFTHIYILDTSTF